MKYKGAQPEQYIVKPTVEQFKKYQEAANGLIKYITMATETDDDFALTRYCAENGVVVSIGHSAATSKEAVQAFAHGARSMTHVYNGMTPFNHRANGLVGAAYRMKSMYGEIICDGNHSTPLALHQSLKQKDLITESWSVMRLWQKDHRQDRNLFSEETRLRFMKTEAHI